MTLVEIENMITTKNGLFRKHWWYLVRIVINRCYKEFAVFKNVSGPRICTKFPNGTVSARREIEQVKSKRNERAA